MVKAGRVTWIDYTEDDDHGLVARLSCRMENKNRRDLLVKDIEPWFFVRSNAEVPDSEHIVRVEEGYESLFDEEVKKVVVDHPYAVSGVKGYPDLSSRFEKTYEADIPMYRKLSVVDGLSGHIELPEKESDGVEIISYGNINTNVSTEPIEPRILIADIEVKIGDESFDETVENGSQPIICISTYDTFDDEYKLFYYNKHELSDGREIRSYLNQHWGERDERSSVDIELIRGDTEEEMMKSFVNYIGDTSPDLFTGYNFVNFDAEYIINRCKNLDGVYLETASPFGRVGYARNKRMKIRGIPTWDMMKMYAVKFTRKKFRSKSLDYVANEELDAGKVDDVNINEEWKNNPERLLAYNLIDTQLCKLLNDQSGLFNFYFDVCEKCSVPMVDVEYELRLIDGYILSRRSNDEILPTSEEEKIPNSGGYVHEPVNGRITEVGTVDLKSLYPSSMLQFNLSTETISNTPSDFEEYVKIPHVPEPKKVHGDVKKEDVEWDWLYASMDKEGIIPRNIKNLFKDRDDAKKMRNSYEKDTEEWERWERTQRVIKEIMNSFYGNSGSPYWRLSRMELAESITSTARYALWKGFQYAKENDIPVLYADTDSLFVDLQSDDLEFQINELNKTASEINSYMDTVAEDIGMEGRHPFLSDDLHGTEYTTYVFEAEYIAETFMQLGKKKRYCSAKVWEEGTFYEDTKFDISGYENQRSDSMLITAELQQEVIEKILSGASFEELSLYLQNIIDSIDKNNDNVKQFALPGSINKDLKDYPNRQVPRACMWSNEHLEREFSEGDDPFVYLVKETPSDLPNTDVLALEWNEEIPDGFKLDREAIIERGIKKPIESIVNEMNWQFEELRSGKEQKTMDFGGGNPFE